MKIGDKLLVVADKSRQHPKGSIVVVEIIHSDGSVYCKAEEGYTAYWYEPEDVKEIKHERT